MSLVYRLLRRIRELTHESEICRLFACLIVVRPWRRGAVRVWRLPITLNTSRDAA
jgi:hypothetical protein